MRLTIVETGLVPESIRDAFPDYPQMFRTLLQPVAPDMTFDTVSPVKGEAFPDASTLEAILITGSPAGVYDDTPWMQPLMDFIRSAARAHVPQVGICFGHQAMAEALGGKVIKSDKGWGIGRHTYEIAHRPAWMDSDGSDSISIAVSHQDQVVALPKGAHVIARSDFTPIAGIDYGPESGMSFQCHPEFNADYSAALYKIRRGTRIPEDAVDAAIASLSAGLDRDRLARWIARFLSNRLR